MDAIKQWTFPLALLVAWLAAAGYTVARLSWASEAWQMRAAAEIAQPAPARVAEPAGTAAAEVTQPAPATVADPAGTAAVEVTQPAPATAVQIAGAARAESESTQPQGRLGRRLLARSARQAATAAP